MFLAQDDVSELVADTFASTSSDFYRVRWEEVRELSDLPIVTREDFRMVPLKNRRYKIEKALVKIVQTETGPFLSEWSLDDIGQEPFGVPSKRPMVYLENPHEAIEKSLWCYMNNMVPLIGEKDPEVAMFAARKYQIDSIITDTTALRKLTPYLEQQLETLSSISILGDSFETDTLLSYRNFAEHVRLVVSLPETGVLAEAPLAKVPKFVPLPHCVVQKEDGALIVTKIAKLTTPIIRYRIGISDARWIV